MTQSQRKIISKLTLDEVSGVTVPAQAHALVTIMKNDNSQCADDEVKDSDSNSEEDEMSEVELEKALAKVADLEALVKMSDAERAHLATLDKSAADSFKEMTPEDRAKKLKKAHEADDVIKSGDVEIRKSVVGDAAFAILKSQEIRLADAEARIAKAQEETEIVTLTKSAETDYAHLPGETIAKVAVLRHAAKMPEDVRKTFESMLKAADGALAPAFATLGRATGTLEKSQKDELRTLTKAYATTNSVTDAVAEGAVLKLRPDLYEG